MNYYTIGVYYFGHKNNKGIYRYTIYYHKQKENLMFNVFETTDKEEVYKEYDALDSTREKCDY